jgi:hypothetical protein
METPPVVSRLDGVCVVEFRYDHGERVQVDLVYMPWQVGMCIEFSRVKTQGRCQ